jgi:invasion protein IalB
MFARLIDRCLGGSTFFRNSINAVSHFAALGALVVRTSSGIPALGRAALVALLLGAPHLARAAESAEPLWHKSCSKDVDGRPSCVVEQFAVAMPQKTVMLHIRFAAAANPDQTRMMLTTPLGVLLQPGLTLSVDGSKPIALPFERCSGQGCEASAVLDKGALAKFVGGKALVVRYAVSDKAGTDVPMRLEGLEDALKSLAK